MTKQGDKGCFKRIRGGYPGQWWRCGMPVAGWRRNKAYCWIHLDLREVA